ncbi:hypothetical protein [Andreprevotia lacus]|uniref:hypothetical protein n=1 Tax=Andreprevotia lacus TaxID=1121000 RepID=UPI001C390AD9|nr:hypothetical protein [Andreprevotia lacus]
MGIVICVLNGGLRVVQSAAQARALLQNTDAVPLGGQGAAGAHTTAQSQGYYLPASGDIILIADHLPGAEHAVWAAAHELGQRHADRTTLPAAARELRNLALVARQNRSVNALASAIARQHGLDDNTPAQRQQAAEAALAELAELAELAATRNSGDWDALQQRYGVRMPLARRDGVLGVQARFADKLQDWFGRYAGMRQNEGAQGSAVLAEMLAGGGGQRAERVVGDVGLAGEAGREYRVSDGAAPSSDAEVDAGKNASAPGRLSDLKAPNRRHYLEKINQKSLPKEQNTVIAPTVNVVEDVAAIRAGRGIVRGNTISVNNRVYGYHDGTLFPMSGDGFYTLSREAFKALGVYNQFGNTARAKLILDNMKIDASARQGALEILGLKRQ